MDLHTTLPTWLTSNATTAALIAAALALLILRARAKHQVSALRTWLRTNPGPAVTLAVITLSVSVAVPFQASWFYAQFTESGAHPAIALIAALAMALLIEGLTWLGAVYYYLHADTGIGVVYRAVTVVFALVAAGINFWHGLMSFNGIIAVIVAIASLMGVGAWELHMMRNRQVRLGLDAEQIKIWASRRRHYKSTVHEARALRATYGTTLAWEAAWRLAYVRVVGLPTLPVAYTDTVVRRVLGSSTSALTGSETEADTPSEAEVEAEADTPLDEGPVAVAEVPMDFRDIDSISDLIASYWPELSAEATDGSEGGADRKSTSARGGSNRGDELPPRAEVEAEVQTPSEAEVTDTLSAVDGAEVEAEVEAEVTRDLTCNEGKNGQAKTSASEGGATSASGGSNPAPSTSAQSGSSKAADAEVEAEVEAEAASRGTRKPTSARGGSRGGSSGGSQLPPQAEVEAEVEPRSGRKSNRKSTSARTGSQGGSSTPAPTANERKASPTKKGVQRYLARVANKTDAPALEDLPRTWLAHQFDVSTRTIRDAISEHRQDTHAPKE